MQVLDAEKWKQKLGDARRTGKLNISYFNLPEITPIQVEDIKVRTRDVERIRASATRAFRAPFRPPFLSLTADSSTSLAACGMKLTQTYVWVFGGRCATLDANNKVKKLSDDVLTPSSGCSVVDRSASVVPATLTAPTSLSNRVLCLLVGGGKPHKK